MPDLHVEINGRRIRVAEGTTVASAMLLAGEPCRMSVSGEARFPLCGMGICYECRAVVNGIPHQRTCQLACQPEMVVRTQC